MASIIFYGAGRNACEKFDIWVKKGLKPVCFSDADPTKHYTQFMGIEILPLIEAVKKYSDYKLYCTQISESLYEVQKFLFSVGIPKERIKFCEDFEEEKVCGRGQKVPQIVYELYPRMYHIYQALQDDLSRIWFLGRMKYSLSHSLTGIYQAMLCDEHQQWIATKQTYGMQWYGLPALWELLKENYPIQKQRIYLMAFDNDWNEYNWIVERFLEAMSNLGITINGCIMPYADGIYKEFKGIACMSEKEFLTKIDGNTCIIIGFPGWCLEMKEIVDRYKAYKDILFPIADIANPQYIESEIMQPDENEIYVDVGVYDLQNSIDFIEWASKGWKKIYAFEPDPYCYQRCLKRLKEKNESSDFLSKVELIHKGLSDCDGILEFPAEYKVSGAYVNGKTIPVAVVSLDSYLDGKPVTFVKMDVEGAEMSVLHGMK